MYRPIRLFFLVIILTWVSSGCSEQNNNSTTMETDFNTACTIFTEANQRQIPQEEIASYIVLNLRKRVTSKEISDLYSAVFQIDPEKRYAMFKSSAEDATSKPWDCPSLKVFFKRE